jgi:hypothetical protein
VSSDNQYQQYNAQRQNAFRMMLLMMMLQQGQQQQRGGNNQSNNADWIKKLGDAYKTGKSLYGLFDSGNAATSAVNQVLPLYSSSGVAANAAANAAWNAGALMPSYTASGMAANEAANAAWNAGSSAAGGGAEVAGTGAGGNYAGWIAAAMSALNSARSLTSGNLTDEQMALEAEHAAPRAVAAFYTAGLSTLAEGFARKRWGGTMAKLDSLHSRISPYQQLAKAWTSDKWKDEGNRLKKLEEQGVDVAPEHEGRMYQQRGMKFDDLLNKNLSRDFKGYDPKYGWVNNAWTLSRNEADLAPEDIIGTATMYEKFGKDWMGKYNTKQRLAIAKSVLDNKALDEHQGTWDVKWTPELEKSALDAANQIPSWNSVSRPRPQRYSLKNGELLKLSDSDYQSQMNRYNQPQQQSDPSDNQIIWAPDTIYYRPELSGSMMPTNDGQIPVSPQSAQPAQQSRPSRYMLRNGELILRKS